MEFFIDVKKGASKSGRLIYVLMPMKAVKIKQLIKKNSNGYSCACNDNGSTDVVNKSSVLCRLTYSSIIMYSPHRTVTSPTLGCISCSHSHNSPHRL